MTEREGDRFVGERFQSARVVEENMSESIFLDMWDDPRNGNRVSVRGEGHHSQGWCDDGDTLGEVGLSSGGVLPRLSHTIKLVV